MPENISADLYLELLKKCLTRSAFPERFASLKMPTVGLRRGLWPLKKLVLSALKRFNLEIVSIQHFDERRRQEGLDWPEDAETMVGLKRLDNLQFCIRDVISRGVPGDLVETGVWRGGASIFMRAVLASLQENGRTVWLADSFQGLPKPDGRYGQDAGDRLWTRADTLAISLEQVKRNFSRYGLLDDRVKFLVGWFKDTLPAAPIERISVLRLDGDMYASTMDALDSLYPKVSAGGFVIVDDFGAIPACKQAVEDYRSRFGIQDPVHEIDWTGVYWQKSCGESAKK